MQHFFPFKSISLTFSKFIHSITHFCQQYFCDVKKLITRTPYSLLSFAAILFMAVGMPLVHPAIHEHLNHGQVKADHHDKHFPANPDEDKARECPACDFQATNHLFADDLPPFNPADEPIRSILATAYQLTDHREALIKLLFKECDREETTLVFVSHDRSFEKLFDRTIRLNEINMVGG
jgi:hypothetical protein